jgi:methylase of polypeptide subunit release factors
MRFYSFDEFRFLNPSLSLPEYYKYELGFISLNSRMRVNITQLTRKLSRQLLKVCDNDTGLAQRELHWMLDHVLANKTNSTRSHLTMGDTRRLIDMVNDRVEHHKPLQYILGTQPFCELDIITRPPTLIPR